LFVVADGMGAHAAGELASKLATDTIPHSYAKRRDEPRVQALVDAVRDANNVIFTKGQDSVDFYGMGTTCSCLLMLPGGALVAHVGDSRVYRLRGYVLEQLTFDHSLVWELAAAGNATEEAVPAYVPKNVITRSLGPNATVNIDVEGLFPYQKDDCFLLCSDGLTGPLSNELIGMVLATLPANKAAQTLVDLANLLGGPDNITVIVAEMIDPGRMGAENPNSESAMVGQDHSPSTHFSASQSARASQSGWFSSLFGWLPWRSDDRRQGKSPLGSAGSNQRDHGKGSAHGKGPYRCYPCQPQAKNIEILSDIVRQLEDLEDSRDWQFDWQEIQNDRHLALQAIARGEFDAAVVAYCSAVRCLMTALRKCEPPPVSDSDIGLR
jgi:protein phosphatase